MNDFHSEPVVLEKEEPVYLYWIDWTSFPLYLPCQLLLDRQLACPKLLQSRPAATSFRSVSNAVFTRVYTLHLIIHPLIPFLRWKIEGEKAATDPPRYVDATFSVLAFVQFSCDNFGWSTFWMGRERDLGCESRIVQIPFSILTYTKLANKRGSEFSGQKLYSEKARNISVTACVFMLKEIMEAAGPYLWLIVSVCDVICSRI